MPNPNTAIMPSYAPPRVYREGWDAASNGKLHTTNPYTGHDFAYAAAWRAGYEDVMAERAKHPSS